MGALIVEDDSSHHSIVTHPRTHCKLLVETSSCTKIYIADQLSWLFCSLFFILYLSTVFHNKCQKLEIGKTQHYKLQVETSSCTNIKLIAQLS